MRIYQVPLLLALWAGAAWAEVNPEPTVAGLDFADVRIQGDRVALDDKPSWLAEVRTDGGTFDSTLGAWVADAGLEVGLGRLLIQLDRTDIPSSDLALSLIYEETPGADFVVQLLDEEGRIVAPDLFSNIVSAGREAKTDTFIISFLNHPTATQIVLRRIQGEVRIYGFALMPVACEVPLTACEVDDLAILLGQQLRNEPALLAELERIAGTRISDVHWDRTVVQRPTPLSEINAIADQALSEPGYPEYVPSTEPVQGHVLMINAGSSLGFLLRCNRTLNLYHSGAVIDMPRALTSADAYEAFYEGMSHASAMSVPMTVAERERFYRKYGYHPMEIVIAMGAVQVLVNRSNPLNSLTIPQLDAIYGSDLRAGEQELIRTWDQLGFASRQPIEALGALPPGGTARLFQARVLQGGPFRDDMITSNPKYPNSFFLGLVWEAAENPHAIAFSNLQNTHRNVKQVALARNSGEEPVGITAESVHSGAYPLGRPIYLYINATEPERIDPVVRELLNIVFSRQGQEHVGEAGLVPLTAEGALRTRQQLGL